MKKEILTNAIIDTQDGLCSVTSRLRSLETLFGSSNLANYEGFAHFIEGIANDIDSLPVNNLSLN